MVIKACYDIRVAVVKRHYMKKEKRKTFYLLWTLKTEQQNVDISHSCLHDMINNSGRFGALEYKRFYMKQNCHSIEVVSATTINASKKKWAFIFFMLLAFDA